MATSLALCVLASIQELGICLIICITLLVKSQTNVVADVQRQRTSVIYIPRMDENEEKREGNRQPISLCSY